MLRLDVFSPDIARQQTRVLQLQYIPGRPARPVAFVEHYCDVPGCDCRRVIIRVQDLQDRTGIATVAHQFDEPDERTFPPDQTILDPLARDSDSAILMLGVVQHLLEHHDYQRSLESHYQAFKDIVARRDKASARPQIPEGTGRNDPCPCGSGRKFKKCCLRRQKKDLDDIPRRHDLSLDDFRTTWRDRAESIDLIDQFFAVTTAAQLDGDNAFAMARNVIDGLHIDIDRDGLLQMLHRGHSRHTIAKALAQRAGGVFTDCPELLAPALQHVAESLTNHWAADVILPRTIETAIDSGYILADTDDIDSHRLEVTWSNWAMAWSHLVEWLDDNASLVDDGDFLNSLDEIIYAEEPLRNWLHDLAEMSRKLVESHEENFQTSDALPNCLEVLEQIEEVFADAHPAVANDAAVNRYYALLLLERPDEATEVLTRLVERPTENLLAPLFLGDVYGIWGHAPTPTDLDMIIQFCERTIDISDDQDLSLLEDAYQRLVAKRDAVDAD